MRNILFLLIVVCMTPGLSAQTQPATIIAFGSCGHQDKPWPILDTALLYRPDMFIFLGDNIYGDTKDMSVLQAKYRQLSDKPEFQRLRNQTRVLATWDDHDYGWNDSGRHYPFKPESKQIFLDFWGEPENSPRRQHEGIYTAYLFEYEGKILQIILLDNRTFRDDLLPCPNQKKKDRRFFYDLDYQAHTSKDSTLLGEAQWAWLEQELRKPADVRIIGTGTQFGISYNGYEAWANFPHEQERMFDLIRRTRANGVLFISGDVHYGEISRIEPEGLYPIYDVTASGITSTWDFPTPNDNRIEGPVMDNHFGLLHIYWHLPDPVVQMEIIDVHNNQRVEYSVPLRQLTWK